MEKDVLLNRLSRSYQKLLEALELPDSQPLAIDGTLRRFECTYMIACEAIQTFYRENPHYWKSPNKCIREAIKNGWIDNPDCWASLIESKAHASFLFSEQLAKDTYETIKKSHHVFRSLISDCKRLTKN